MSPDQAYKMPRHILLEYHKQLVTSRTTAFHQHNLQLLGQSTLDDPEARRKEVIKRVARELWTNFVARGEDTAMLRHLKETLCKDFNETFQFTYEAGGFELIISRKTEDGYVPVNNSEKINITNRAWYIALETISAFTLS